MTTYENIAAAELAIWKKRVTAKPSFLGTKTHQLQQKINGYIPENAHKVITSAIKQMVQAVLFGSMHTTYSTFAKMDLQQTELLVREKINTYTTTAAVEGGVTGMGGILLGLADFPIFLSIKMKLLFEVAALYGHNVHELSERVYLLHIFQLTFSSQQHRREVFTIMEHWDDSVIHDLEQFDWRKFQQEYRDHLDLAKLAQLIPGIGAVVGYLVNKKFTQKLGDFAMNAYRMRRLADSRGNVKN